MRVHHWDVSIIITKLNFKKKHHITLTLTDDTFLEKNWEKNSFLQLLKNCILKLGQHNLNIYSWKVWKVVTPLLWVFAFFWNFASVYYFFAGKSSNSLCYIQYRDALKLILHQYFSFFHFPDKIVLVPNCWDSRYVLFVIKFL